MIILINHIEEEDGWLIENISKKEIIKKHLSSQNAKEIILDNPLEYPFCDNIYYWNNFGIISIFKDII